MLTELKISNFRIFDDEVTVRFRPITVLIGRNSSGKSSIIKFLLMLQQSLGYDSSQFLNMEGDKVKLGVFSELKNSLTQKRNLIFKLAAKIPSPEPDDALTKYLEPFENVNWGNLVSIADATVSYSEKPSTGQAAYSLVDETFGKNLVRVEVVPLDSSSIFLGYMPHLGALDYLSGLESSKASPGNLDEWLEYYTESFTRSSAELEVLNALRDSVRSIHYLSPVRYEPRKVIIVSSPPSDNVGPTGEYALPILQRIMTEHYDKYEFILPHVRSIGDIDRIEFRIASEYVSRAFAKNKTTGADVLIADYGFGVGQCLPILVQGAIMPPHTTLMVEQPEAQLHPTAQLELGSFFADLWTQRQVRSIIETHSRNILLRLRRLIAKGELSHGDVSVAFFTIDENSMPIVKNLDIAEDGSMEAGLPMEFFGADIMEGLKIGARA